jgi:hypothetical protein
VKFRNPLLVSGVIAMLVAILWTSSGVIGELQSWDAIDQPAVAGKLMKCGVYGLIALACGLGIDIKPLLGPVAAMLPFMQATPTSQIPPVADTPPASPHARPDTGGAD